ncbi:unnamed protein product [Brassica napus]|uniref:(rape) hypothetical protein n=1 Tax=Brassica napus TaxID=3708 RepID=A0A816QRY2_BRANA|nr:unnamed protein product [Brassica napus]
MRIRMLWWSPETWQIGETVGRKFGKSCKKKLERFYELSAPSTRTSYSERTEGSGSWDTLEWNKLNSQHTASGSSSTSFANLSCLLESERVIVEVSPESASQFGELVADPVTNELLHYTEKPETFVRDRINCCVYVFTPDIFTAIRLRDVSSQRKDTAILRRVSSFEALQPATRFVCLSLVCVSLHT